MRRGKRKSEKQTFWRWILSDDLLTPSGWDSTRLFFENFWGFVGVAELGVFFRGHSPRLLLAFLYAPEWVAFRPRHVLEPTVVDFDEVEFFRDGCHFILLGHVLLAERFQVRPAFPPCQQVPSAIAGKIENVHNKTFWQSQNGPGWANLFAITFNFTDSGGQFDQLVESLFGGMEREGRQGHFLVCMNIGADQIGQFWKLCGQTDLCAVDSVSICIQLASF